MLSGKLNDTEIHLMSRHSLTGLSTTFLSHAKVRLLDSNPLLNTASCRKDTKGGPFSTFIFPDLNTGFLSLNLAYYWKKVATILNAGYILFQAPSTLPSLLPSSVTLAFAILTSSRPTLPDLPPSADLSLSHSSSTFSDSSSSEPSTSTRQVD